VLLDSSVRRGAARGAGTAWQAGVADFCRSCRPDEGPVCFTQTGLSAVWVLGFPFSQDPTHPNLGGLEVGGPPPVGVFFFSLSGKFGGLSTGLTLVVSGYDSVWRGVARGAGFSVLLGVGRQPRVSLAVVTIVWQAAARGADRSRLLGVGRRQPRVSLAVVTIVWRAAAPVVEGF
jgi:hypothetical protein